MKAGTDLKIELEVLRMAKSTFTSSHPHGFILETLLLEAACLDLPLSK